MTHPVSCQLTVNGVPHTVAIEPSSVLADVLRDDLGLRSVRVSCDQSVCGACTVLVNDDPVAACSTLTYRVDGARVATVEGLARPAGDLDPLQAAFIENFAFQCGFCTPGMLMSVKALLAECPNPDREEIASWLAGNICRCTGYEVIIEAVEAAAEAAQRPEVL